MKICILGLGYVGAVSTGCLAANGHNVIGVDTNKSKVELIASGLSPIVEKDLEILLRQGVDDGLISATVSTEEAIRDADISFVCVGTPGNRNGEPDLRFVRQVCQEIGRALKYRKGFHVVVIRSTLLPGSMAETVIPLLESSSGLVAGKDFGVCNNPEFLREGTAVSDFQHPPKTVIGEMDSRTGDMLAEIYKHLDAPLIRTDIFTAEMVKYTDNVWHALKICFANEIGNICKEMSIDSHRVMSIFCEDTKLNLSSYYLKPGFAFGGSCLPKDVRALCYKGKSLDLDLPLLNSIMVNNGKQVNRAIEMVIEKQNRKVSILGISFKAGTDDLRESPVVELAERLIGKGYEVKVYDPSVNLSQLTGANKTSILSAIPHIAKLMVDGMNEALDHGDTIVIGNNTNEFSTIMEKITDDKQVIDLVRISDQPSEAGRYDGICW